MLSTFKYVLVCISAIKFHIIYFFVLSQIRDKKAHRKHIATMNPINVKECNSLSCTLLLIVYCLFTYRNHLTSTKVLFSEKFTSLFCNCHHPIRKNRTAYNH